MAFDTKEVEKKEEVQERLFPMEEVEHPEPSLLSVIYTVQACSLMKYAHFDTYAHAPIKIQYM